MDIFTLADNGVDTYNNGEIINGLTSKVWIERYRDPGEFTLTCYPTKEIRAKLAIDTLISHTDTMTVMMVEDHEIKETKGSPPELTITGRSLDAFLNHRVATNHTMGFAAPLQDDTARPYEFEVTKPWLTCVDIIRDQIHGSYVSGSVPFFAIPHIGVSHEVTDVEDPDDFDIKRGPLHSAVLGLLDECEGGIKIVRPNPDHKTLKFIIHKGAYLYDDIIFSYNSGDLATSRYFWSERAYKNYAYVAARYQGAFVAPTGPDPTGFEARVMWVDANDLNANPSDSGWAAVSAASKLNKLLKHRGKRTLKKQKKKHILEATISNTSKYVFGVDYNIGDLVYVQGNYDLSEIMRVTEYAKTEDERGSSGFPIVSPTTSSEWDSVNVHPA